MEKIEELMETYIDGKENRVIEEEEIFENVLKKITNKQNNTDSNLIELIEELKLKKTKIEIVEDKIIEKIYKKFEISQNVNLSEPIDLVYTFINNNDFDKNKSSIFLKKHKLDCNSYKIIENYLNEEKNFFYDFFVNLEITRKNLPFLRNIFIITPTPFILSEIYNNDSQIIIVSVNDLVDVNNINRVLFRPNNIIYFLKNLRILSNVFLYGSDDCIISKNIFNNRTNDKLLKIYLEKKNLNEDNVNNIRYLEEYNANKLFESKFNIFFNYASLNQINLVRKDSIKMMSRIFGNHNCFVDYLLLQYLTGLYFNIYELDKNIIHSGYYHYNKNNPYERFLKIRDSQVNYFCFNNISRNIIPYYLHSVFVNIKAMKKKTVKEVYIIGRENLYIIPEIERALLKNKITLKYIEKLGKYRGKLENDIFISSKKKNLNTILIVGKNNLVNDVLYFCNLPIEEEFKKSKNVEVYYPVKFIRTLEMKTGVPYTKILPYAEFDEETTGVRNCKLQFRKNDLKNK